MLSARLLPASSPCGLGNFAEPSGAAHVWEGAAGRPPPPPTEAAALRSPSEEINAITQPPVRQFGANGKGSCLL